MIPMFKRAWWARYSRTIHLAFAWVGGAALLMWGLSGLMHPIMTWTGPEQARFFPPRLNSNLPGVAIGEILGRAGIAQAVHVRVQPSFDGPVLQVSEAADQPRRYFSLQSGAWLPDRDRQHAIWLARYYTGLADADVASVVLQTSFDADYPWVNRLLPVWRIEFATSDQRRAYVYTELNALGSQHNGMRAVWQSIFLTLHTWSWLERFENARVVLIGIFMAGLLGMTLTGIAMLWSFTPRRILDARRRWHHRLALFVWFPVFLFSSSGAYHLLQDHLAGNTRGKRDGAPVDLRPLWTAPEAPWRDAVAGRPVGSVSLIEGPAGLLLRVEQLPDAAAPALGTDHASPHDHHGQVTRQQRFEGRPTSGEIAYLDPWTGGRAELSDEDMARHLAVRLGGARPEEIIAVERITRFGLGYDFRNKRLPVWQISLSDAQQRTLFIDSSANMIVDQLTRYERMETWSFAMLHKWNFLRPFGAVVMDGVIVTSVLVSCVSALVGFVLLLAGRRRRPGRHAAAARPAPVRQGAT